MHIPLGGPSGCPRSLTRKSANCRGTMLPLRRKMALVVILCTGLALLWPKISEDQSVLQKPGAVVDAEEREDGTKKGEGDYENGKIIRDSVQEYPEGGQASFSSAARDTDQIFGSWRSGMNEKVGPEGGKSKGEEKERDKEGDEGNEEERDQEEGGEKGAFRREDDGGEGGARPPEGGETKFQEPEGGYETPPTPHVLLLGSSGRVGSSFLGDLLSKLPGALYFYEPFHDLEKFGLLNEGSATGGIKSLMTCEVRRNLIGRGVVRSRRCNFKPDCFTPQTVINDCETYAIRVIKTIRTYVAWLPVLLADEALNLRVIHLVRDPRAALISIWERGWDIEASNTCNRIVDDLSVGRQLQKDFPGRYMVVRYEDICLDPRGAAEKIMRFLGYSKLPDEISRFLTSHTKKGDQNKVYSTFRNTKDMAHVWRSKILHYHLKRIEDTCSGAIRALGFRLFKTIQNVRNLSIPVFSNGDKESYFQ